MGIRSSTVGSLERGMSHETSPFWLTYTILLGSLRSRLTNHRSLSLKVAGATCAV